MNARHVQVRNDVRRGDPSTAEIAHQSERDGPRARLSIQLQAYKMGLFKNPPGGSASDQPGVAGRDVM